MGFTSQTLTAKFQEARSVKITNLTALLANTEYSHALETNVRGIIVKARNDANIKLSFELGESGTTYVTIHKGTSLTLKDIDFIASTLYLQVSKDSSIIEIVELY